MIFIYLFLITGTYQSAVFEDCNLSLEEKRQQDLQLLRFNACGPNYCQDNGVREYLDFVFHLQNIPKKQSSNSIFRGIFPDEVSRKIVDFAKEQNSKIVVEETAPEEMENSVKVKRKKKKKKKAKQASEDEFEGFELHEEEKILSEMEQIELLQQTWKMPKKTAADFLKKTNGDLKKAQEQERESQDRRK